MQNLYQSVKVYIQDCARSVLEISDQFDQILRIRMYYFVSLERIQEDGSSALSKCLTPWAIEKN